MLPLHHQAVDVTRPEQADVSPLIPQYKKVSERCSNKPKQVNTIKLWRNMSTNKTL